MAEELIDRREGADSPVGESAPTEDVQPPLRISRRACVAGLAALAVAAVGGIGAAASASRNAGAEGELLEPAADAAGRLVGDAFGTAADARHRAITGEGIRIGTVCVDAGHGGGYDLTWTPIGPGSSEMQYVEPGGTSGVVTGRDEADVNLEVALRLRDKLVARGVDVVMVREDDSRCYSSEERAQIANSCGADLFVRLHCDGADWPSLYGFTTLVPGYNEWTAGIVESSAYAASIMHPIIIAETGANDCGIVERYDLAGFNFCQVPVVLYEMGFMSNPDEDLLLSDPGYQDRLAQGICDGAVAYLEAVAG